MNLSRVLSPDVASTALVSSTKDEVINELLAILVKTGNVSDEEMARRSLFDRERKMSTGMQHGIAIPHGKTSAVEALIACIGISRKGIDFESLDGQPSRIFVMTLSPVNRSGPHIQFLAEISQLLKSAEKRQKVLEAETPEELVGILTT